MRASGRDRARGRRRERRTLETEKEPPPRIDLLHPEEVDHIVDLQGGLAATAPGGADAEDDPAPPAGEGAAAALAEVGADALRARALPYTVVGVARPTAVAASQA